MEKIQKAHTTIMVSDMDRSVAFYIGILGLTLAHRYGDHYAEVELPGAVIGLHPTAAPIRVGNNFSLGLGVGDLDQAIADLQAAGITCTVTQDGPSRLAHFTDPDGNGLYLVAVEG